MLKQAVTEEPQAATQHDEAIADEPVLVVDLDGTLLRSDMLYETFWSTLAHNWRSPFQAAMALLSGRAALKRYLAEAATIDATTLPYDRRVIDYVAAWRASGGRTALVTASDQGLASRIAEHLGLFDEVHGSDGVRNVKGSLKAEYLCERYGATGYAYMGNATTDLPVWQRACKAITVNAPAALQRRAEALGLDVEHLKTAPASPKAYARALRPHQWLKNSLIFVPMLAAHEFVAATFVQSLVAFVAFSLVASSVYVLNDLLDLRADRAHPRKCQRPFASGSIPIAHGIWMAGGLILLGAGLSTALGPGFFMVLAAYFALTTAYSLDLKRRVILDIAALAGLYTMRIVAGGVATGIPLSVWLLAFSIFFFFALAAVKRQAELVDNAENGRDGAGGRDYAVADLPLVSQMAIGAGYVSVLVMALYLSSPAVAVLYSSPAVLWGICPVLLYWITRMVMITHRGEMDDDPVVFAATDRISQLCCVLIFGFAIGGMLL